MKTNKCTPDYLKLKEELKQENMIVEAVRSRRNSLLRRDSYGI